MKNIMKILIGFLLISVHICFSAKLPPNFKKCDRKAKDFLKCTPVAVHEAMRQLTKPIKELGIPSLNPLEVSTLTIGAGTSAVGLTQNFSNVKIFGVNNLECSKMNIYFDKKKIENECFYPQIRLEADYDLRGKILLLDVYGTGKATVFLDKVTIAVNYTLDEYEKNFKKHFKILDIDLKLFPTKMQMHFDNLFNGDKTLGENVNKVVNENWEAVFDDIRASYNNVFGQITRSIFNNVLSKVSVSDLFGEE